MNKDLQIIQRIQSFDEEATEELYLKYVQKLYNYFYYRVFDKGICEDLLSQTWFHIFDKVASFDVNRSQNVSGWMYSIAHNKLIDYYRKNINEPMSYVEEYDMGYDNRILEKTNAMYLVKKISNALKDIHPHAKDIVLMKLWEGMSHKEISNELKISESNSRKIFSRSISHLQEHYGELVPFICLFLSI